MADDEMRRIILKIVKDEPSTKKAGAGKQLAIVQWAKGDKSVSCQVIQSDYWINENNGETYYKAKGIPLAGIQALFGPGPDKSPSFWVREKIAELMKNPPAPPKPTTAKPSGIDDPNSPNYIEEVPF